MLGMTAGQEFPADVEGHLHRELVLSREQHARYGAHQGRADEMGASRTLEQVESSGKSEELPSCREAGVRVGGTARTRRISGLA